jgi:hypothetical protein
MFAKPGFGGPGADGIYISDLDDTGFMYLGEGMHKWFGFYFGISADWAWPAIRLM